MTIPFNPALFANADYLDRLTQKYKLSETPLSGDSLLLLRTIQPVTQVDRILRKIYLTSLEITPTATGYYTCHTVPTGKRNYPIIIYVARSTGAAELVSEFEVYDGTTRIPIEAYTPASTILHLFDREYPLKEKWELSVYVSTHNAGDKVTAYIYYEEEDAY